MGIAAIALVGLVGGFLFVQRKQKSTQSIG